MSISLFASAIRSRIWEECLRSLEYTTVDIEVVFGGTCSKEEVSPFLEKYPFFKYIHTKNIKPAQVYECCRRACTGELICWVADDCEFPNDVLGKAYRYWKEQDNEKLILSIQTKESGYGNADLNLFNMDHHRFFGYDKHSPLMAPLGIMSRKFLNELGGLDRRYVCGQYENDIVMRAYTQGGSVEIFGDENVCIEIDHLGKSIEVGESKDMNDFLNRPFATGYKKDRAVLESSWAKNGVVIKGHAQQDEFEPYDDKDILTVSQSNKGKWE